MIPPESDEPRKDPRATFRDLASHLRVDGTLSPRQVVVLDAWGKALALGAEERRDLSREPATAPHPGPETLFESLRGHLGDDLRGELRCDLEETLRSLLGLPAQEAPPPPLCPSCPAGSTPPGEAVWTPGAEAGLSGLEGVRRSLWACRGCHTVHECVDDLSEGHHSRQLEIRVPGTEISRLLWELRRSEGSAPEIARHLEAAPTPLWILERHPSVIPFLRRNLGPERGRLLPLPELAPEAYRSPRDLCRLGPPPTPAHWLELLASPDLSTELLLQLVRLPGIPEALLPSLMGHPDPEVAYQILLSPDLPRPLLEEILESQVTKQLLALLDRDDVGRVTLERALSMADPHVLYRALRHPCLDLLLLEQARRARRNDAPGPLPPSRALHVYAPLPRQEAAEQLDRFEALLREVLRSQSWNPCQEDEDGLDLAIHRVTRSRVLLHLPPGRFRQREDLALESLVGALVEALGERLAREVIDLGVDEAAGSWTARLHLPEALPCDFAARDLPACEPGSPVGAWLEFELLVASRALPYAGLPDQERFPRLRTRPPYLPEDAPEEAPRRLRFRPPDLS